MSCLFAAGSVLCSVAGSAYYFLNHARLTDALKKTTNNRCPYLERMKHIFSQALRDMGINDCQKISLLVVDSDCQAYSFGNQFSKEKGVIMSEDLMFSGNYESISFVFKHEIAHIQKNHLIKIPCYGIIAGIIPLTANFIYPIHLIMSIACSVFSVLSVVLLYTRNSEFEADLIAATHSSRDEIISTMEFMQREREQSRVLKNHYEAENNWRRHFIAKNGDNYMDFLHPPISLREEALRKFLRDRTVRS